jgi:hypothetical protein
MADLDGFIGITKRRRDLKLYNKTEIGSYRQEGLYLLGLKNNRGWEGFQ